MSVLNGKVSPGGGYHTYLNWLKDNGSEKLFCMLGDVVTFIDNIGKYVLKNYRVSTQKTASADVITTCLHIDLEDARALQSQEHLKPSTWGATLSLKEKQQLMNENINHSRLLFRRCRYNYISRMIGLFKNEQDSIRWRIGQLINQQKRHCTNQVRLQIMLPNFKSKTFHRILFQLCFFVVTTYKIYQIFQTLFGSIFEG